ncbi:hypothetical protein S7711_02182, partial [Stachybotrys chartarum IBT 7711]
MLESEGMLATWSYTPNFKDQPVSSKGQRCCISNNNDHDHEHDNDNHVNKGSAASLRLLVRASTVSKPNGPAEAREQPRNAMSGTPRMRSGFPATPGTTAQRRHRTQETPSTGGSPSSNAASSKSPTLPLAPESAPAPLTTEPLIPLTLLDAPQQRLYAVGVYVLLWAWKLYDWLKVVEDGEVSWALFLKWVLIDFAFLFGLPELRIPWLELSQFTVLSAFSAHVILNYFLMFNIPLPWQGFLLGLLKIVYDRELAISESNVRVSNILNNHSLIMGKQIINILPEGSAVLNPLQDAFCLSSQNPAALLPLHFNATVPAEIELIRVDLDTQAPEVIKLSSREIKRLAKQAREHGSDPTTPFHWSYPVKKTGIYRLGKVLDEYKLEVQRTTKDTYVVQCPQAKFLSHDTGLRCIRDLSDLSLEVNGTPPLQIAYNRTFNAKIHSFHFQSLIPDSFTSPLIPGTTSVVTTAVDNDVSWVRSSKVVVGLNESMTEEGVWEYSVDKVTDGFGNTVVYARTGDDADRPKHDDLVRRFSVKERPKVRMQGCDLRNPLKVAKGRPIRLPILYSASPGDTSHQLTWAFSPIDTLTNSGDHGDAVTISSHSAKSARDLPVVSRPGLYTLKSVSSGACEGEVDEPSTCLLLNPLEPHLAIKAEEIPDKCAGNSIGLRVDLDLVGTPPFLIRYEAHVNNKQYDRTVKVKGLKDQLELIPQTSDGHHKYVFKSIDDDVYKNVPLNVATLEQTVKPAAFAFISNVEAEVQACLNQQVDVEVELHGDAPFTLEWETLHDGKRKQERLTDIQNKRLTIKTAPLTKGGEYIISLSSVQDTRGCKRYLKDAQLKVMVRRQQPRGGFGLIEQSSSIMAVEGDRVRLPLRLQGEAPWTVEYRNLNGTDATLTKIANNPNDHIQIKDAGIYKIVGVSDKQCPGLVDPKASEFRVDWYPRPEISLVPSSSLTRTHDAFVKQEVCEGDIDGFEVALKGSPPYHVRYEVKHKSLQGSLALNPKNFDAALSKASISMDTTKPGDYTYTFFGLEDDLYRSDKNAQPLVVQQRVNAKPSAAFTKPSQSFKFCVEEQEHEDKIPITLTGVPPFDLEIEIKHQGGSPVEVYRIPSISSNSFGMQIPRQHLRLGSQQVRIRNVRDARGCQRKYDVGVPAVQIQMYDAPSIFPLETRQDYCVGERIAYTLSGTPPFDITYDFNGRWNAKSQTTSFRRIAEKPGEFVITSISDKASECRAAVNLPKTIHPLPSVQISRGRQSRVDIHEGNEVDISFDFWGTPPFEFTYTRSTNARKGHKSVIIETRHDISYEHSKVIKASQEGTYEVVAIKD